MRQILTAPLPAKSRLTSNQVCVLNAVKFLCC
eukprot:COSAG04_NODE_37_length_33905_cov_5.439951_12_plen_32_part_00